MATTRQRFIDKRFVVDSGAIPRGQKLEYASCCPLVWPGCCITSDAAFWAPMIQAASRLTDIVKNDGDAAVVLGGFCRVRCRWPDGAARDIFAVLALRRSGSPPVAVWAMLDVRGDDLDHTLVLQTRCSKLNFVASCGLMREFFKCGPPGGPLPLSLQLQLLRVPDFRARRDAALGCARWPNNAVEKTWDFWPGPAPVAHAKPAEPTGIGHATLEDKLRAGFLELIKKPLLPGDADRATEGPLVHKLPGVGLAGDSEGSEKTDENFSDVDGADAGALSAGGAGVAAGSAGGDGSLGSGDGAAVGEGGAGSSGGASGSGGGPAGGPPPPPPPEAQPGAPPPPPPPLPPEAAGQPPQKKRRGGDARAAASEPWGIWSIAPVRPGGVQVGWGVTCGKHHNVGEDMVCKRRVDYGAKDPMSDSEIRRRLKQWLILGCAIDDDQDDARAQHMAIMPKEIYPLPLEEDLDETARFIAAKAVVAT
ncbi:unnamed protein product, partial [Prorocentrum cordatum]